METTIMAIKILRRSDKAPAVQEVLTKFGCIIKMRLGLHEAGDRCSEHGLILLQLIGETHEMEDLAKQLNEIEDVIVKSMSL